MKKIFQTIVIVFILTLIACEKTEEDHVPPSVVTITSEPLNSGGAILYGDFRNFDSGDELGFIISNNSNPNLNPILTNPIEGENSVNITSGLHYNQVYYFQAYIKTENEIFYGLGESFLSTGSSPVSFLNISPNKGNFYDTVEIETKEELNADDRNDIRVYFNNTIAEIEEIEANKITCIVPYFEGDFISSIKIDYFGKTLESSLKFELDKPRINSVSTSEVTFGDEMIINGENFENGFNTKPKVYIDDVETNIIENTETTLKVIIPNEIVNKTPIIKVLSNLQEVIAPNLIKLKKPILNNYPRSVNIFDEIILRGQNFNPSPEKNTVYFDDVEAVVLSSDSNRIRVKVPSGIYTNWEPLIRIEVSSEIVSEEYPISILDACIKIKSDLEFNIFDFQRINGIVYLFTSDVYTYKPGLFSIVKYSIDTNSFYDEKIVNLPYQGSPQIIKTSKEFIYLYFNRESSNFYRINLVSGSIKQMSDFPGERRTGIQTAVYNRNIFIGGGKIQTPETNGDYEDSYKYLIDENKWVQNENFRLDDYKPINHNLSAPNNSFIIQDDGEIYQFNGTAYIYKNKISSSFKGYFGSNHFFYQNKFFVLEARTTSYLKNNLRIFNSTDYSMDEIEGVMPKNYTIIGLFQLGDFAFIETIDYHNIRHLFKLDLNKL